MRSPRNNVLMPQPTYYLSPRSANDVHALRAMQTEVLRYERDRLLTHKSMVHALTRQRAMHECEIDKHYQHQHQERENSELSATVAAAAAKDQLVTLSTEHDKLLSVVAEQRATIERLQASLFAKEADLQRAHAAAAAASTAHAKALAAAHAATEAKAERMAREHAESLADVRARADVVVRAATMLVAHPPDPTQPLQLVRLGARSQTMPVMGGTGETVGAVFRRLAGDDGGMLDVKELRAALTDVGVSAPGAAQKIAQVEASGVGLDIKAFKALVKELKAALGLPADLSTPRSGCPPQSEDRS